MLKKNQLAGLETLKKWKWNVKIKYGRYEITTKVFIDMSSLLIMKSLNGTDNWGEVKGWL